MLNDEVVENEDVTAKLLVTANDELITLLDPKGPNTLLAVTNDAVEAKLEVLAKLAVVLKDAVVENDDVVAKLLVTAKDELIMLLDPNGP